jgi:acetyl-CoA synthetase
MGGCCASRESGGEIKKQVSIGDFNSNIDPSDVYAPPSELAAKAHCKTFDDYKRMYVESINNPEKFWGDIARENFHWQTPFKKVGPTYNFTKSKGKIELKWFDDGKTNISYNCLDRQIELGRGDKTAFIYECNDVDDKAHAKFTYSEVRDLVCKIANGMKAAGVKKGDRVSIYLPMVVELPAVMLACARIGAIHSVVFGGFSAEALAGRLVDAQSTILFTADGVMRGAKPIQLKQIADAAVELAAKAAENPVTVKTVVCVMRLGESSKASQAKHEWNASRDVKLKDFVAEQSATCEPEWMDSEDPLFMLYTSGSTGKPKGVLHTTAGYMMGAYMTTKYTFDIQDSDIWFCTADCGWITGHTYIAYGPLLNGATAVVFEGVPTYPDAGRFWAICDKYKVTGFYTAPTAIRTLMKSGEAPVQKHDLSSVRLLGTVGEPINPEAWKWYHTVVGGGRCPVVDTYWQTETGSHLITPLPGAVPAKPGSASLPFFGVVPAILDDKGKELSGECQGRLVIKQPTPSMMRTVYGDHARFEDAYFKECDGYYFTGDGCKRDKDGFYWITGRMDDVINVSGHRIGTAEVESALVANKKVAEAAVVAFPEAIKGSGIYAYVTLKEGIEYADELKAELKQTVRQQVGPFATPDYIHWAPGLPKTRSGKIMRRILRKLALPSYETEDLGDVQTLADPSVVEQLKSNHPYKKK